MIREMENRTKNHLSGIYTKPPLAGIVGLGKKFADLKSHVNSMTKRINDLNIDLANLKKNISAIKNGGTKSKLKEIRKKFKDITYRIAKMNTEITD